jgi:4,5-dihydroxyphthalate decarboxylase
VSRKTALSVLLGDYPHTRVLWDGTVDVPGVDCDFRRSRPLYAAFPTMVRDLGFDVCEMAIATYLQAKDDGVPISLLPVVMIGGTHHQSLTRLAGGPELTPGDLPGRRVGVRSYGQTTGLWVRGILFEDHGIHSSDITWVTTEEPHVARPQPPNVERSRAASVGDLLRAGEADAAVLGPRAPGGQGEGLVPVIPDAAAAAAAWIERHQTIPVNHMVVVRDDVLRDSLDSVRALVNALRAAIAATAAERDPATPAGRVVRAGWDDSLARALETAAGYALEQDLVRSPVDLGSIEATAALFDD